MRLSEIISNSISFCLLSKTQSLIDFNHNFTDIYKQWDNGLHNSWLNTSSTPESDSSWARNRWPLTTASFWHYLTNVRPLRTSKTVLPLPRHRQSMRHQLSQRLRQKVIPFRSDLNFKPNFDCLSADIKPKPIVKSLKKKLKGNLKKISYDHRFEGSPTTDKSYLRPIKMLDDSQKLSKVSYCSRESVLPDHFMSHLRVFVICWETGLDAVQDNAVKLCNAALRVCLLLSDPSIDLFFQFKGFHKNYFNGNIFFAFIISSSREPIQVLHRRSSH